MPAATQRHGDRAPVMTVAMIWDTSGARCPGQGVRACAPAGASGNNYPDSAQCDEPLTLTCSDAGETLLEPPKDG
jgi:hypothetical protein